MKAMKVDCLAVIEKNYLIWWDVEFSNKYSENEKKVNSVNFFRY